MTHEEFLQARMREVLTLQEECPDMRYAIQFCVQCAMCKAWEWISISRWQDAHRLQISGHKYGCPVEQAYVQFGKAVVNREASYELDPTRHARGIDNSPCPIYLYSVPLELFEEVA